MTPTSERRGSRRPGLPAAMKAGRSRAPQLRAPSPPPGCAPRRASAERERGGQRRRLRRARPQGAIDRPPATRRERPPARSTAQAVLLALASPRKGDRLRSTPGRPPPRGAADHAAALPARAQLKELETKDLRLVYFDPSLTYLTPHVGRCFENALAFHRKLFDYRPSGKVTVLLDDFADYGNAAADRRPAAVRQGRRRAALASRSRRVVANERMNWLMNHELVHVTAADQAAGTDRFFRGLFRGQGERRRRPAREHPLLLPDRPARRGAALVPGGARRLRRDLDGRRAGPRAGRLRRDGLPLDGEGRRALLRPARPRVRGRQGRLPDRGRTPTSTARAS